MVPIPIYFCIRMTIKVSRNDNIDIGIHVAGLCAK